MRTDVASRVIAADPDAVFHAFLDADQLTAWLPPRGMRGELERFDPRPGGGFRMVLVYDQAPAGGGKAGLDRDVSEVEYTEIDPPGRLVQSIRFPSADPAAGGVMTMTWTFAPRAGGTEVTIRATDVPDVISAEDHALGMASSLENLARLL